MCTDQTFSKYLLNDYLILKLFPKINRKGKNSHLLNVYFVLGTVPHAYKIIALNP